ncbi:MATE family multidrug resistance protein [Rhodoligotrophos appendicifer]|uniref:MATE family efflux transporter n=1 Tax=Rhodoligotrophos appendicifer TaxID=987056 RepID=UPI0019607C98|nr:MATE family efflux transporter [Rhodoligotrophos appendicifer]
MTGRSSIAEGWASPLPMRQDVLAESKSMIRLALPLVVTNVAQIALTTTSLAMVGRLGADQLAAAALAITLYTTLMLFCLGILTATMPMLAQALSRGEMGAGQIRSIVAQGFWSALFLCVPIWLLLWNSESLLILLGQPPALAAQASGMMHWLQWSLLPYLAYLVCRSFLATIERPGWTLVVVGVALIVNLTVGSSLIFGYFGPAYGLRGAAMGLLVSNCCMLAGMLLLLSFHKDFKRYELVSRVPRPDRALLGKMWRLGLPMGITIGLESSIFYAAANMMGIIGPASLAAHAAVTQITALFFMVPIGVGQAATIRVGLAFGAGRIAALKRAGWVAYALGAGVMIIYAAAILCAPVLFLSAFLDVSADRNAAAFAVAQQLLVIAAFFAVADGIQVVCIGMLRGLHDSKVPMYIALIGYWGLALPLGAVLAFHYQLAGVGVWIGLAVGLTLVAILVTYRWITMTRRLIEGPKGSFASATAVDG